MMKPAQHPPAAGRGEGGSAPRPRPRLLPLLACAVLCRLDPGRAATPTAHAASNAAVHRPGAARPALPAATKRGRLPLFSSRSLTSRRAAKEAYLSHLREELESARRQLYVSQNTCGTLRRRWEEQRTETLGLLASLGGVDVQKEKEEERQSEIRQREEEIERLRGLLENETEKYEGQVERLGLLSAEVNELQAWKEERERSSNEEEKKLLRYERELEESRRKQSDYAEQVDLLSLKLEAAEFAARQSGREEGGEARERRVQSLKEELESVRAKYCNLMIQSRQEGDEREQQQLAEEMDEAIQSAVGSALETVEREWETRCEALEDQLRNVTGWATELESERDAALSRAEEAASSSIVREEGQQEDSDGVSQRSREEMTAELTEALTAELTETLTTQLTDSLGESIKRRYKKKYKHLRDELKELRHKTSTFEEESQNAQQQREQALQAEMESAKERYEREYQMKVQELQMQSEEQEQAQKERMRKLVRALLAREAKPGGRSSGKTKASHGKEKKKDHSADEEGGGEKQTITSSPVPSSRRKKRSKPGVVPVRGNR